MDAGNHAAHELEGTGVSGEVKVHEHVQGICQGELKGGARIIKQFLTLKIFKMIEKFKDCLKINFWAISDEMKYSKEKLKNI